MHAVESDIKRRKDVKAYLWTPDGSLLNDGKAVQQYAYSFWADAVEAYAPKKLTRDGEKFVAISGIAKTVQYPLRDDYLAGLWRRNLLQGFLWKSRNRYARPPDNWRATTWSWASTDGEISMHCYYTPSQLCYCADTGKVQVHHHTPTGEVPFEELATVEKVEFKTLGNDPMGAITEVHIFITGKLVPAVITEKSSGEMSLGIWMEKKSLCVIAGERSIFLDHPFEEKSVPLFCFPLLAETGYQSTVSGLLLILSSGPETSRTYQRFGTFTLDRNDSRKAYCPQRFGTGVLVLEEHWTDVLNRLQGEVGSDLTTVRLV
ncbi:hypothetical protein MMC28_004807 [Mycoblastus sanguinarius]|nr:hypothetical protein [Mycoblastus sanguinarius]